jgi:hypothetical protein
MRKNYFFTALIFMISLPFFITAQNLVVNGDLESWSDSNTPDNWDLFENISQESTTVNGGSYSAAQMSESSSKKFRQDVQGIVGGQQYTISYFFFDNTDDAKTRIWSYWMDVGGTYLSNDDDDILRPGEYSENSSSWQTWSQVLTAPSNATQLRFEVRAYNQDGNVGGYVYYDDFSVEGSSTNYPEPTNYPTDFEAEADGFVIDVSWTDATGAQLPGAYLLLGQKGSSGNFTVPEDGTPVPDDLDWADGKVAVNVTYGNEMYPFSGLEGAQEYEFTIFPYTNAGENINYKTDGTPPYDKATTANIVVINEEDFEDGTLGTWGEYSVEGPQTWENYEYNDELFARMSGYDDGAVQNEDWLISPQMNLSPYQTVKFEFINAWRYDGPSLQLFLSQNYDGEGNPNDFTWLELTDEVNWSPGDFVWVESGIIDLSLFVSESCYLAFKYTSSSSEASAWEIDNLSVYGEGGVGVLENNEQNLILYPNPAASEINFHTAQQGTFILYSLTGQQVLKQITLAGLNTIQIQQLPAGTYLWRFNAADERVSKGKLLVR